MIKIYIPNNNIPERKYILDIIFSEFLDVKFEIHIIDNLKNWDIKLNNGKTLSIEDTFFNKYMKDLEYLKIENIPKHIHDLDIFAASFFMLTRWEEYVYKARDEHMRFPAEKSLAYKENFLSTPIVNEYLEELKINLQSLDNTLKFKEYKYSMLLTHDVDYIYKWDTFTKFIRHLAGDIILRKSFKEFYLSIIEYIKLKLNRVNDPFDTFDYIMDLSDKYKVKSYFFFMGRGKTKFDNNYKTVEKNTLALIEKIKRRKHNIGMHYTYDAYNNNEQLYSEKLELETNFDVKITSGRAHFLRFETPTTWQILENNNIEWDSTVGYADKEGFRCGVCYEYSVFNILTRKKLKLKEKPLIVMEGSFFYQNGITPDIMEERIINLVNTIKKYNGQFVFLWHNSSFNIQKWREYKDVYEKMLAYEY